eukprot:symbB.v1.2.004537.t1/scaffold256.1/size249868/8
MLLGTVRVFGQASLPLVGVSTALFFKRRYTLQQWCSLIAVSLGLVTFYFVKAEALQAHATTISYASSQIFHEHGKLDVNQRIEDGFREGPGWRGAGDGMECLLLDRPKDEKLDAFVERCRKKLRKAKDDVAQAMVLALLVSDTCGRSGTHQGHFVDLEQRCAERMRSMRTPSGDLILRHAKKSLPQPLDVQICSKALKLSILDHFSASKNAMAKLWLSRQASESYGRSKNGQMFAENLQLFLIAVERYPEMLENDVKKRRHKNSKEENQERQVIGAEIGLESLHSSRSCHLLRDHGPTPQTRPVESLMLSL